MPSDTPRPAGLRPTLRQLMIVTLGVALLLAKLRMMARWGIPILGGTTANACMNVALSVSFFPTALLFVLLLALDRPGHVRNWYCACCWAGQGVLAGVSFLLVDLVCFDLSGRPTIIFPMFPILGAVILWVTVANSLPSHWPRRCSVCGARAVIVTSRQAPRRLADWNKQAEGGWCAVCGAEYEREGATTAWRPKAAEGHEVEIEES